MSAENEAPIVISAVKNEGELMQALALREIVFIEEQSVPESMERDEEFAPSERHPSRRIRVTYRAKR